MIDRDSAAEYLMLLASVVAWIWAIATCDRQASAQDIERLRASESAASLILEAVRSPDGAAIEKESLQDGSISRQDSSSSNRETKVLADISSLESSARSFLDRRPDGLYRMRERGAEDEVRTVVRAAVRAAEGREWPDAPLLLALAWRESRWRPGAIGARGERGLAQIHPRWGGAGLDDPYANLAAAAGILERALAACGDPGRALVRYATGNRCGRPWYPDRLVLRWAKEMR